MKRLSLKEMVEQERISCRWYDDERDNVSIDCPYVRANSFNRCEGCPYPKVDKNEPNEVARFESMVKELNKIK